MSERIQVTPKNHDSDKRHQAEQAEVETAVQADQDQHLQQVRDRQNTMEHDVRDTLSHIDKVLGWTALTS